MPEDSFLAALQSITAGTLSLSGLVGAATSLIEAGQGERAEQLYRVWIGFNGEHPQLFIAQFNCGGLLSNAQDLAGAEAAFRGSIALNPDFLPAYINLGGVLERQGAVDAALAQWQAVVDHAAPVTGGAVDYSTTALKQIARVLTDHQQHARAEAALRQCLDIDPGQRDVVEQLVSLRMTQCEWPVVSASERVDRETLMGAMSPLSMAAYSDDPMLQLATAARYIEAAVGEDPGMLHSDRRHAPIDLGSRRLRVGYVSSDLRDHAIGYLTAEVFELHDRAQVEVFAYYCGPPPAGALNERIRAAVEHWRDIRTLSDDDAARQIAADGIDILVDVNGLTRDARTGVFARRPAPILVNWLGYPGSMGSPYHQYIIADDWIIPPESEIYYTEKVLRLPCYQPNDRRRAVASERPTRRDAGLPQDGFVFCCFNGAHKISRFTFERWLAILQRTPDSVLWLLDAGEAISARLGDFAEQHGVSRSRLAFAPKQANAAHLARYPLADLFLDTAPYGAHTTASDALWMGVPVLTLSGRSFASRVCASLVRSAGLGDLVCDSPEAYVERAVMFGQDRSALQAYRDRLEAGRHTCTLFDMEALVGALEGLYRTMCADHPQGRSPRPDLANLPAYLQVGIEDDHEASERLACADYEGLYKARLARRHRLRPIPADSRLWTAADIALAEG